MRPNDFTLRRALPDEAEALSALAWRSKAHWPYPPAVLAGWRDDLRVTPDQLAGHPVFVADSGGKALGFALLLADTPSWTLEHFWIAPEAMGRGLGRALLAHVAGHAAAHGALALRIDSDPHAEAFYLACGAVRVGLHPAPIESEPDRQRPQMRLALPMLARGFQLDGEGNAADRAVVNAGIGRFNDAAPALSDVQPLAVYLRDGDGLTAGGAVGRWWGTCCELEQLWVTEALRGQHLGQALMARFEQRARAQGCSLIYLETFSFQAPGFYQALGYEVALAIEGYTQGVVKYTLQKRLAPLTRAASTADRSKR